MPVNLLLCILCIPCHLLYIHVALSGNGERWICEHAHFYFINAREGAKTLYGQPFGQGTGPTHMIAVECQGNESSILQCNYRRWGIHPCYHTGDASVNCTSYRSMFYIFYFNLQHLQARSNSVGVEGTIRSILRICALFTQILTTV